MWHKELEKHKMKRTWLGGNCVQSHFHARDIFWANFQLLPDLGIMISMIQYPAKKTPFHKWFGINRGVQNYWWYQITVTPLYHIYTPCTKTNIHTIIHQIVALLCTSDLALLLLLFNIQPPCIIYILQAPKDSHKIEVAIITSSLPAH